MVALAVLASLSGCQFFDAAPAKLRSPPAIAYLVHAQDQLMCSTHLELGVDLKEAARLELAVTKEDAGPSGPARMVFALGSLPAGAHQLQVPMSTDVPFGTKLGYELAVYTGTGEPRVLRGTMAPRIQRSDHTPISQLILLDVLTWDGHLRLEEKDLDLEGVESMLGNREYVSTAADRAGLLGPGWRARIETTIRRLPCGYLVLEHGIDSRWYAQEDDGRWRSPAGYNSTLLTASDGSFVFYSMDGTEYLFRKLEPDAWYLVRTRVPGEGTGLQYRYERIGKRPHLVEARHGSRSFTLRYDLAPASAGQDVRLRQIAAPDGARTEFEFDAEGRLSSTKRIPASGGETRLTYVTRTATVSRCSPASTVRRRASPPHTVRTRTGPEQCRWRWRGGASKCPCRWSHRHGRSRATNTTSTMGWPARPMARCARPRSGAWESSRSSRGWKPRPA